MSWKKVNKTCYCCVVESKKKERRRTLLLLSLMMSFKVGLSGIAMIFLIGTVKKGFSIIALKPAYGNEELEDMKKNMDFLVILCLYFSFSI